MSNAETYQQVTDSMVAALEAGTVPWRRTWQSASPLPMRLSNKEHYRGINTLILWLAQAQRGYSSTWWGTYRQIKALGGQVRRGERSTAVLLWKPYHKTVDGEEQTFLVVRIYRVFNLCQADWPDGPPAWTSPPAPRTTGERIARAEEILAGYKDGPAYAERGSQPAYLPGSDTIECPPREWFETDEAYYASRFHEAAHSTGHPSRLGREGIMEFDHFGSQRYGREELVAELGAAFLAAVAGIGTATGGNSAAYLAGWVKTLKGDPGMVVHAAAAAQRAADRILGVGTADEREED
jgi:antirestriction protein ArdC